MTEPRRIYNPFLMQMPNGLLSLTTISSSMEYQNIQVSGSVSVERVVRVADASCKILIMGPTGAGKSSFIEALGLRSNEKISSNGLNGYTENVSTYIVKGVVAPGGYSIHVIDSPGFADTKISVMGIVSMLQKWLKDNKGYYIDRIIYLTPATRVRFPRSQRDILRAFQALTGDVAAKSITIVATMWDTISSEAALERAEETYKQLQTDIWKDLIEEGAHMTKFFNTQDSALSILDLVANSYQGEWFPFETTLEESQALRESTFATDIYHDLQNRINNLQSMKAIIESDLEHAEKRGDKALKQLLQSQLKEVKKDLMRFKKECHHFESPGRVSQAVYSLKLWGKTMKDRLHG